MQGGNRRAEQGRAGNLNKVDSGDTAGMPKDAKPASSSPTEHHEGKREGTPPLLANQTILLATQGFCQVKYRVCDCSLVLRLRLWLRGRFVSELW